MFNVSDCECLMRWRESHVWKEEDSTLCGKRKRDGVSVVGRPRRPKTFGLAYAPCHVSSFVSFSSCPPFPSLDLPIIVPPVSSIWHHVGATAKSNFHGRRSAGRAQRMVIDLVNNTKCPFRSSIRLPRLTHIRPCLLFSGRSLEISFIL